MLMRTPLLVALLLASLVSSLPLAAGRTPAQASPAGIAGAWQGTLVTPAANLRLAINVTQGADGKMTATLSSLDQGP